MKQGEWSYISHRDDSLKNTTWWNKKCGWTHARSLWGERTRMNIDLKPQSSCPKRVKRLSRVPGVVRGLAISSSDLSADRVIRVARPRCVIIPYPAVNVKGWKLMARVWGCSHDDWVTPDPSLVASLSPLYGVHCMESVQSGIGVIQSLPSDRLAHSMSSSQNYIHFAVSLLSDISKIYEHQRHSQEHRRVHTTRMAFIRIQIMFYCQ